MTRTEAARLAAAVAILRPDWPATSLQTFIDRDLTARPYFDAGIALTWIALDPTSNTPKRVLEAGPWWHAIGKTSADQPPPTPPCRDHGGTARRTDGTYGCCHADTHEAPPPEQRQRTPPPAPLAQLVAAAQQPQPDQPEAAR